MGGGMGGLGAELCEALRPGCGRGAAGVRRVGAPVRGADPREARLEGLPLSPGWRDP
ncbi:hypothetical protein [Synechococcus sp. ATX 2A4]|uniref:hypothetical protein n=1 Tax=Synechococcus sp. ATX 2A4 TaxID=2823727 RepID=UPI0020CEC8A7|nr:hypothetical protein [Synechococcus sp. ATX 2A4]